ncbi:sensor histidine kinase [Paenibacillaceae bacterium]|nr:sensor histidine kinase [Paenibacillaceae bacterium]
MWNKLFHTVRWKFLYAVLGSLAITAALLFLGFVVSSFVITYPPYNIPIRFIVNKIGSAPFMVIVGCPSFLIFFYWLSNPVIRQLTSINDNLQNIASGRFTEETALAASNDELGQIAATINRMSQELSSSLDDITHGLQEITRGNFDHEIPVHSTSQLSLTASSINEMSKQLHQSILEERTAEKTKNDLITGVSHDLRTPLTSILGFLEVIENDRYQDEVELRYYVNIAYEKSLSLKKLIDELFEYTRVNNGLPLELEELDVSGFIHQIAEEFVPSFENAGLTYRIQAPAAPMKIIADGNRLVRAYENLISNAIRYGQQGKYVDFIIEQVNGLAVINITNYGEPIPAKDLPFIFDRFYRGDYSRSSGGTGLGLAIAKSIVEVQGGQITASSSREKTTFATSFKLLHQDN